MDLFSQKPVVFISMYDTTNVHDRYLAKKNVYFLGKLLILDVYNIFNQ